MPALLVGVEFQSGMSNTIPLKSRLMYSLYKLKNSVSPASMGLTSSLGSRRFISLFSILDKEGGAICSAALAYALKHNAEQ